MSQVTASAAQIFEEHTPQVYAWAYRLLGRHHDALDVVQDVFVKWLGQCRERTPDQPRSWLRRVTLNRAIDMVRRRAFEASAPLHEELMARADGAGSARDPDREQLRGEIALALDGLSELQRAVLIAKVYEELTFAEIATELGIAPSTAKTHYLRAITAVRDRLTDRWK